jgi:putative restriction endonuclease
VLAGGYEDTQDFGEVIIYTGHGGRDPESGRQKAHQTLTRGNLALAYNTLQGLPVRVIRGARQSSLYAPEAGYRYDGLYMVEDYWREVGKAGFDVWRYRLRKIPDHPVPGTPTPAVAAPYAVTTPSAAMVLRIVRDTAGTRQVKALYHYRCQICSIRLATAAGPYAEAAHIRPLHAPHHGPDTPDNILCLCPNHHELFNHGGIAVADDFTLIGAAGCLRVDFRHRINRAYLHYHREHYGLEPDR